MEHGNVSGRKSGGVRSSGGAFPVPTPPTVSVNKPKAAVQAPVTTRTNLQGNIVNTAKPTLHVSTTLNTTQPANKRFSVVRDDHSESQGYVSRIRSLLATKYMI
jgi:hypothetical protein